MSFLDDQVARLRQLGERCSPTLAELVPGLTPGHLGFEAPRLGAVDVRQRLQAAQLGLGAPSLDLDLTGASKAAQTALLTFSEALPGGFRLVLFTSEPDTVLPTIRSRCYHWRLPPLPRETFEQLLRGAGASAEQIGLLPRPYPGTFAEALQELRVDRGGIDALLRALALRDPVASINAAGAFDRQQARLLALLIRRHLSNLAPMPVIQMLRLTPDALAAWVEALAHPVVPAPAAVRWGALMALSN